MDSNEVHYVNTTSMELESVELFEFLEFVTPKKVHKDSKGPEKRGTGSPIETKKNNVNTIRNTLQNIGSSPIKSVRWLPCLRSAPWVYFTMLG